MALVDGAVALLPRAEDGDDEDETVLDEEEG